MTNSNTGEEKDKSIANEEKNTPAKVKNTGLYKFLDIVILTIVIIGTGFLVYFFFKRHINDLAENRIAVNLILPSLPVISGGVLICLWFSKRGKSVKFLNDFFLFSTASFFTYLSLFGDGLESIIPENTDKLITLLIKTIINVMLLISSTGKAFITVLEFITERNAETENLVNSAPKDEAQENSFKKEKGLCFYLAFVTICVVISFFPLFSDKIFNYYHAVTHYLSVLISTME
ncbi:hypothetical protein [Pantoea sp. SGAir0418]